MFNVEVAETEFNDKYRVIDDMELMRLINMDDAEVVEEGLDEYMAKHPCNEDVEEARDSVVGTEGDR